MNKNLQKIIAGVAVAATAASMVGCNKEDNKVENNKDSKVETTTTETETPSKKDDETETPSKKDDKTKTPSKEDSENKKDAKVNTEKENMVKDGTVSNVTSFLNIRKEDSISSEVVGRLYNNDVVKVLATKGDWKEIEYNGVKGYVHSNYLNVEGEEYKFDANLDTNLTTKSPVKLTPVIYKPISNNTSNTNKNNSTNTNKNNSTNTNVSKPSTGNNGSSSKPSTPSKPSEPSKPSTPSKPSEPSKPDMPSKPDKPDVPDTPDIPVEPIKQPTVIGCDVELEQGHEFNEKDFGVTVISNDPRLSEDDYTITYDMGGYDKDVLGTYHCKAIVSAEGMEDVVCEFTVVVKPKSDAVPPVDCYKEITIRQGEEITSETLGLNMDKYEGCDLQIFLMSTEVGDTIANICVLKDGKYVGDSVITVHILPRENVTPEIGGLNEVTVVEGTELTLETLGVSVPEGYTIEINDNDNDLSKAGIYQVTLELYEGDELITTKNVKVTVKAKEQIPEAPIPELTVPEQVYVHVNSKTELDKALSYEISNDELEVKVDTSKVNLTKAGTYTVTYSVKYDHNYPDKELTKTTKVTVISQPVLIANEGVVQIGAEDVNLVKVCNAKLLTGNYEIKSEGIDTSTAGYKTITFYVVDETGTKTSYKTKVLVKDYDVKTSNLTVDDVSKVTKEALAKSIKVSDINGDSVNFEVKSVDTSKVEEGKTVVVPVVIKVKNIEKTVEVTVTVSETKLAVSEFTLSKDSCVEGDTITLSAKAEGKLVQYKFLARTSAGKEVVIKDYSTENTATWKAVKGVTSLVVEVKDFKGNVVSREASVNVTEKLIAPTLNVGANTIVVIKNQPITLADFKATATDMYGNDITSSIQMSSIDTTTIGTKKVTLSVTDKNGLKDSKTVDVIVENANLSLDVKPSITMLKGNTVDVSDVVNSSSDDFGNPLSIKLGDLDTSTTGENKTLVIIGTDKYGNTKSATVKVTVADNPTINVKSNITVKQNAKVQISDIVESATDWKGNDITSKVSITGLDTSVVGTQKVTVSVTDSYGYVATKITNVKVVADTPVEKKYKVNSAEYKQIMNKEMYRLIAELRAEKGSPVVGIDDGLQTLARLKNEHMIQYNYFDHDYNGEMIGQIYPDLIPNHEDGYDWQSCLENLYLGGDTLDDKTEEQIKQRALSVFTAWKNSGIHHATMINKYNTLIGFDYTVSENGTAYATLEAYAE